MLIFLCACRPFCDRTAVSDLRHTSLYEFLRYWRVELVAYPLSPEEQRTMSENEAKYQVNLTEAGCAKLLQRDYWDATPLLAGQDYVVKEEGGKDWLPFPDLPSLSKIRHTWMVVRNELPKNPSFHGAPMPKRKHGNEGRNALITMAYLHPFTLHEDVADENVTHVRHLRGGRETWEEALKDWFAEKVLCSESQRFIQQFFQRRPNETGLHR